MNKEPFRTADFNISTVLLASGFELLGIDRSNKRRAEFIFSLSPSLNKTIQEYWDDKLNISPQKIFNTQRLLKTRLYSSN
jgi:hypothetical protein